MCTSSVSCTGIWDSLTFLEMVLCIRRKSPDERLGFQLYFVVLAICNVWDYIFMPGSGGYLLLMFKIKIVHICLIFCRSHKSTVACGKNKALCFTNIGSVA